jgi:hypothetical protein
MSCKCEKKTFTYSKITRENKTYVIESDGMVAAGLKSVSIISSARTINYWINGIHYKVTGSGTVIQELDHITLNGQRVLPIHGKSE